VLQRRRGRVGVARFGFAGGSAGSRVFDPHAPQAFHPIAQIGHHPRHPVAHFGCHLVGLALDGASQGRGRRVVRVGGDQGQRQDRDQEEGE